MSESATGLIVLAGVTIASALLAHWRMRRYVAASIVSALVAAVVFQCLVALQLGHIDPFAPIAFVLSLFFSVPLACLVGWLFVLRRRANAASGVTSG